MEWTTERRYRRYEDWSNDEIKQIKEKMAQSPWHTHYHVEPKMGLLNDPNGFSYFDGKWILFYQNFPFGAAHGLKSWVQLESDDLVHFTETGVKVLPDTPLDSHGAYSGSAMQFGDQLFLFYTGNVRDENWIRHPYQVGALLGKDGKISKIDKVLIDQPADSTDHFRDPQIFNFKGQYYAIKQYLLFKRGVCSNVPSRCICNEKRVYQNCLFGTPAFMYIALRNGRNYAPWKRYSA